MKDSFIKQLVRHLVISITGVVIFIVLISITKADMARRAQTAQEFKETLSNRNLAAESLIGLKADASKAAGFVNVLNNRLPNKDNLINFPKEIVDLANRDGVDLGFTFGGEESFEEGLGGLSFSMAVSGSYGDSIKFIETAEKHRYFINFETVSLTRKDSTSDIFSGVISGMIFTKNLKSEESVQPE